jgi:hypothetical protein
VIGTGAKAGAECPGYGIRKDGTKIHLL